MDNSVNSNSVNSIFSTNVGSSDLGSTGESNFLSGIKNVSVTTWIIIILILSFLGLNVFAYLAEGTQDITNFFSPLIKMVLGLTAKLTGSTVYYAAGGAKDLLNASTDLVDAGLTGVQTVVSPVVNGGKPSGGSGVPAPPVSPQTANSSLPNQKLTPQQQMDQAQMNSLNKALNSSKQSSQSGQNGNNNEYQADDAGSSIQTGGSKTGWCYIGEERGFRSCVNVGENDQCMSGQIFPSQDICVNPSLRA